MRIVSLHVACFLVTMALVPLREPGIDGRALRMCVGRRAQWDRGVQALLHFAGLAQALAEVRRCHWQSLSCRKLVTFTARRQQTYCCVPSKCWPLSGSSNMLASVPVG